MLGLTLIYFVQKDTEDFVMFQFIVWTAVFGYQIIYPLILSTKITLNCRQFVIAIDYKIFKRREVGFTKNISRVAIDQKIGQKSQQVIGEYCSIEAGTKIYKFGDYLSLPEKRWLIEEIRNFVRTIDPYKILR